MKFFVVLALAVACAHADVAHVVSHSAEAAAQTLRSESDVRPDGFSYTFETDNGIRTAISGALKNVNAENPAQQVTGEFSYPGTDGVNYAVTFVADENGYQPQGAHLPTSPPIPEAILRAIAYNEAHPQAETNYNAPVSRPVAPVFNAPAAPAQAFSGFARKPANKFRF